MLATLLSAHPNGTHVPLIARAERRITRAERLITRAERRITPTERRITRTEKRYINRQVCAVASCVKRTAVCRGKLCQTDSCVSWQAVSNGHRKTSGGTWSWQAKVCHDAPGRLRDSQPHYVAASLFHILTCSAPASSGKAFRSTNFATLAAGTSEASVSPACSSCGPTRMHSFRSRSAGAW